MPRKIYRRRKIKKRSSRRLRIPRRLSAPMSVHRFTRIAQYANLVSSTTVPVETNYYFTLGNVPNYTEFTALFDQYRITKCVLMFIPIQSDQAAGTAGTSTILAPTIVSAIDRDDDALIATPCYEYPYAKINSMTRRFTRTVYPRVPVGVFTTSAVTSAAAPSGSLWMDSGSATAKHYGLRTYIVDASANVFTYRVLVKYFIECKSTR